MTMIETMKHEMLTNRIELKGKGTVKVNVKKKPCANKQRFS